MQMRDYERSEGLPRMLIDNSNKEIKIQPLKAKVNEKASIIPAFLLHQRPTTGLEALLNIVQHDHPLDNKVTDIYEDTDAMKAFTLNCLVPSVTISRMNRIVETEDERRSFFTIVTPMDVAFAFLVLEDKIDLCDVIGQENNIKLNRSFFPKAALEKEEKYGKFEEKDHVIWSNGGREAGRVIKGWSRFAIRRFNIIYQQVDNYMKDNEALFDSVDRMMTKWWILRKGVKRTGTKRKLDSDRAEGYDSMEQVVMGKFSEV